MTGQTWISVKARSLVPGDAIRWTLMNSPFEVVARVVDVIRDRKDFIAVTERTGTVGDVEPALLPPVVSRVDAFILDIPASRLHRHATEGSSVKADGPGRSYLLRLLHEAAGGDAADRQAVDKVAGCVLAVELDAAKAEGRLPRRMGRTVATGMLAGKVLYGEAVHRQLVGKVQVEDSVALVEPRDAAAEQLELIAEAEADPEIVALLAYMPGARVREVRLRGDAD